MHRVSGPPLIVTQQVHNIPVPIQIYFYLSIICSDTNILLSVYHLFWYKYIPIYHLFRYKYISIFPFPLPALRYKYIDIYHLFRYKYIDIYQLFRYKYIDIYLSSVPIQIYSSCLSIVLKQMCFYLSIICSDTNIFLSIYHLFRYCFNTFHESTDSA